MRGYEVTTGRDTYLGQVYSYLRNLETGARFRVRDQLGRVRHVTFVRRGRLNVSCRDVVTGERLLIPLEDVLLESSSVCGRIPPE